MLASLLMTVAVFTFVLLLGNILREILPLLINGHAPLGVVAETIALLLPFVWVFALPMGLLTATLLVFGRFSADQELTAARASGISLVSLISPILLLSLFCCLLSAWFNMDLGPRSRVAYVGLRYKLQASLANLQLPEGQLINLSTNYTFYTEKNDNGKLTEVMLYSPDRNTTLTAPRGQIELDTTNGQLTLDLFDVHILTVPTNGAAVSTSFTELPISVNILKNGTPTPGYNDMTFWQLQDKLHELEQSLPKTQPTNETKMTFDEMRKLPQNLIEQVRVVMHRQLAISFGSFGFALIGISLGIRVHRRETNIGVAIAVVLALIYFSFMTIAWQLSLHPEFYPHLIVWIPNFLFQAIGAFLLWRANRGI